MKRKVTIILTFVLMLFMLNIASVKANDDANVYALEGASIRLKGVQGLKFNAKLDNSVKNNEHGFYLVYGQVSVDEFKTLLESNDELIVNDKTVFKVKVDGVTQNNEYSVVLTNIPGQGYFDELSAIPFVKVGNEEKLADNPSRSVAVVAMKMANLGYDISEIESLDAINETSKRRVNFSEQGVVEISKGVFEVDRVKLKEQFIADWKTKTGDNLVNLNCGDFFNSAIKGLNKPGPGNFSDNFDLTGGNLYEFFNDNNFKNKWTWLLNYIKDMSDNHLVDIARQVDAVKATGISFEPLSKGVHLIYSLANFFNAASEGGRQTAVLFDGNNSSLYNYVKDYNNSIYANPDNTLFLEVGEEVVLPDLQAQ